MASRWGSGQSSSTYGAESRDGNSCNESLGEGTALIKKFQETEFDYDNVNSPGASSTSSEPVYVRQPGFDHHAHEFQVHPKHALAIGIETPSCSTVTASNEKPQKSIKESSKKYLEGSSTPTSLQSTFFHSPPQSPISIDSITSPEPLQTSLSAKTSVIDSSLCGEVQKEVKEGRTQGKGRGGNHTPPDSTSKITKKKKSSVEQSVERIRATGSHGGSPSVPRAKVKKEPLPMKLRALPRSFWLQPNRNNNQPPSCSFLPPLIISGKDSSDFSDVRPVTPPEETKEIRDDRKEKSTEHVIKVGNPELLFKLFDSVERDDKKKHQTVRRGRPKKTTLPAKPHRDEDPCLVSTATESILPLLPDKTPVSSGSSTPLGIRLTQGQQVLDLISLKEGDRTVSLPSLNVDHGYSQLLSELVLKL